MDSWYQTLKKSPITPPTEIFPIAWGVIYALIIISVIIYIKNGAEKIPMIFLGANIALNLLWSPVFFYFHNTKLALILIVLMIITITPVIIWFFQKSTLSGLLLLPYLIWLFFALYLNYEIVARN